MAVVVVEPGPVWQDPIGANFVILSVGSTCIELGVFRIVGESLYLKAAQVGTWRLVAVIPTHKALARVTPDECHCIIDLILRSAPLDKEPILRLDASEDLAVHRRKTMN